jgi:hypothetical protein
MLLETLRRNRFTAVVPLPQLAAVLIALMGIGLNGLSAMPPEPPAEQEVRTYEVRLTAYNSGTVVATRDFTIEARSPQEFQSAVAIKQAVFGQDLNSARKPWNRIGSVVLSSR